jgi:hypothetical protein
MNEVEKQGRRRLEHKVESGFDVVNNLKFAGSKYFVFVSK